LASSPFVVRAGITGLFPASSVVPVAGSPADNARMPAIQSARKRILYGNTVWKRSPYQGSADSFLVKE
jgi:hypothetical protein